LYYSLLNELRSSFDDKGIIYGGLRIYMNPEVFILFVSFQFVLLLNLLYKNSKNIYKIFWVWSKKPNPKLLLIET